MNIMSNKDLKLKRALAGIAKMLVNDVDEEEETRPKAKNNRGRGKGNGGGTGHEAQVRRPLGHPWSE